MRYHKIIMAAAIAAFSLATLSCSDDDNNVFDQQSSLRMQQQLDNTKAVLTSGNGQWMLDYFPHSDLRYGGYVYVLKFTENEVSVKGEIAPGQEESSFYKLTSDFGPTLTFDTYNSIMHYFATPSQSSHQGKQGDFEFMIMDVTPDEIVLMGKRTHNVMRLHRWDGDADTYIQGITTVKKRLSVPQMEGNIGGTQVKMHMDVNKHLMSFEWGGASSAAVRSASGEDEPAAGGNTVSEYFLLSETGIRFANPVNVAGNVISEMAYVFDSNTNSGSFSGIGADGSPIALSGALPPTFSFIDEFDGDFWFYFNGGSSRASVTLIPDEANNTVTFKFNNYTQPTGIYNLATGSVELRAQNIGATDDYATYIFPMLDSGSFYVQADPEGAYGFNFTKNPADINTFPAVQCGGTPANVTGFIMIAKYFDEPDKNYLAPSKYITGIGNQRITKVTGLVRK